MAVIVVNGFETKEINAEGLSSINGTADFSTVQARTGSVSMRCNPASGASGTVAPSTSGYIHFGLYIATMPSVARMIAGSSGANTNNLLLNTDGTISARIATAAPLGTSAKALVTGRWYWIGWRMFPVPFTGVILQIDGVDQISGTTGSGADRALGMFGTEASAIDLYFDDVIVDDAGFLNPSRVGLCLPISDNARIDFTTDSGGTTSLFDATNNTPPIGIADTSSGTGLNQIRDATNGTTDNYAANLTTYATVGIVASDKVIAAQAIFATAAPSATSPKSGSLTLSNPTIAKVSIGTFYNGSAIAGTYPSGWKITASAMQASPTVTLASSPVLTVTQDTSSTRIAMVCFMGMYVAWTTGARPPARKVLQSINRASSY